VLTLVYKALLLWMAKCNTHNRILWMGMIVAGAVDIIFGCLCFASCGNWQAVLEELPSYGDNPDLGFGWSLELFSGFLAWATAALAILVLIKGIGNNEEAAKPASDANVA
jgi:hypothetical protein